MFDFHYYFAIEFLVREDDGAKKGQAGAVGSQGGAPRHGRAVAVWSTSSGHHSKSVTHLIKNNAHRPVIGKRVSKAFYRRGLNAAEKKDTPHGAE
jgi:hypothetical protein